MVLVEPKKSVPGQKALDLAAAVIEHESVLVRLLSLARIGVFIQMGSVKITQAGFVLWKVRRNPIQDDTYAALMKLVHQKHKIRRSPEAAGGCEIANGLITPGTVEWVLRKR